MPKLLILWLKVDVKFFVFNWSMPWFRQRSYWTKKIDLRIKIITLRIDATKPIITMTPVTALTAVGYAINEWLKRE